MKVEGRTVKPCFLKDFVWLVLILWSLECVENASSCEYMSKRKEGSLFPKAYLPNTPDNYSFLKNSTLTITCKGVSSTDKRLRYPKALLVFVKLKGKSRRAKRCPNHGPIPLHDRTAENTCSVNYTFTMVSNASIYCIILDDSNNCGATKAQLNFKDPHSPNIIEEPPSLINASEGMDLNLTCTSYELPRPIITWYKNGNHVISHNVTWYRGSSTLMLGPVGTSTEGHYWCEAQNALGKMRSHGTIITVFSSPKPTIDQVNQTVAMGTEVMLTCSAKGHPLPIIGWMRDGEDLGNGELRPRDKNGSDVVSSSTANVAIGNHTIVTKTAGVTSNMHSSSFVALHAFTLSRTPLSRSTIIDQVVSNTTTGIPLPSNTTSFSTITMVTSMSVLNKESINNKSTTGLPLTTASIISMTTQPLPNRLFTGIIAQNGRNSTLLFRSITIHDQGRYACYASNAMGNTTTSQLFLRVFVRALKTKPRFEVIPSNVTIAQGMDVSLNCSATGKPLPNITWYVNNSLVVNGTRISIATVGDVSVLMILSVTRDDQGIYVCVARNIVGTISSDAYLIMKDKPITNELRDDNYVVWPVTGAGLVLVSIVIIMVLIYAIKRRRRINNKQDNEGMPDSLVLDTIQKESQDDEILEDQIYLRFMGIDRDWELSRERLQVTNEKLGSGCFGNVFLGLYTRKDSKEMMVAVKKVKDTATSADRIDILSELEILKKVGRHPNVVSLVGACTRESPVCVVIELVEGGSLHDLLRNSRTPLYYDGIQNDYKNVRSSLNHRQLVRIAFDVAKGMHHLHKKQCIHRDLAARNVLIGKNLVAKISDFGLARSVQSDGLYVTTTGGKVPWKWMSPEALRGLYTNKSDIWSFGILLWEIETLGETPYPRISQVITLYNEMVDGYRLEKPLQCDERLYCLMMLCWSPESDSRPEFKDICNILQDMLTENERTYMNLISLDGDDNGDQNDQSQQC